MPTVSLTNSESLNTFIGTIIYIIGFMFFNLLVAIVIAQLQNVILSAFFVVLYIIFVTYHVYKTL